MQESVIYQNIIEKGRQKEAISLISRILNRCFGQLSTPVTEKIRGLAVERLEQLGEDLLDFNGEGDLVAWLSREEN